MIVATAIRFERAEGTARECVPHEFTGADLWHDLDRHVTSASMSAPDRGGYHKCDVTITFADGFTYQTRYDMVHVSCSAFEGVARHVWREWTFYAGTQIPSHLTRESWQAFITAVGINPEAFTECLAKYAIGKPPIGVVR